MFNVFSIDSCLNYYSVHMQTRRGAGTLNQRGVNPAAGGANYEGNRASAFELYKKPDHSGGHGGPVLGHSPAYKRTMLNDVDDEYAK